MAAVGSFGRGAVALRSDADIVVVVSPRLIGAQQAAAFAEALLYPLWDATLAVGHQVVSASDAVKLAHEDLATATELLDLRLLAGDGALVRDLIAQANEGLFGEDELKRELLDDEDDAVAVRSCRSKAPSRAAWTQTLMLRDSFWVSLAVVVNTF